ncbi:MULTISPECIES: hypothetical protein [unclassified Isoptericola]|uniref:hypothetical protein n=1 Tax=unclassified Isoptericola TaxID=2623355 RepID=UPI003652876D
MSENPAHQDRTDGEDRREDASRPDDPRRQAERERAVHDGRAADVGAVPGEKPKDDPDAEGEERFDAG